MCESLQNWINKPGGGLNFETSPFCCLQRQKALRLITHISSFLPRILRFYEINRNKELVNVLRQEKGLFWETRDITKVKTLTEWMSEQSDWSFSHLEITIHYSPSQYLRCHYNNLLKCVNRSTTTELDKCGKRKHSTTTAMLMVECTLVLRYQCPWPSLKCTFAMASEDVNLLPCKYCGH